MPFDTHPTSDAVSGNDVLRVHLMRFLRRYGTKMRNGRPPTEGLPSKTSRSDTYAFYPADERLGHRRASAVFGREIREPRGYRLERSRSWCTEADRRGKELKQTPHIIRVGQLDSLQVTD